MLIADYGSDSGSDDEITSVQKTSVISVSTVKAAPIPSPTNPIPKAKKRTGPVRITLDLPKTTSIDGGDDRIDNSRKEVHESEDVDRDSKKPKLGLKGAGSSSLLGMLPAPKRKLPTAAAVRSSLAVNRSMATSSKKPTQAVVKPVDEDEDDEIPAGTSKNGLLLPSSISRAKAAQKSKESAKEESFDLFGLGSAESAPATVASSSKPSSITIISAPEVQDFVPPPPTATDPYPGYYQLPSGSWAAYDPDYYHSFFPADGSLPQNHERDDDVDDGRVGRHWDELDQMKRDGMAEVDVGAGLEAARRESERMDRLVAPKVAGDQFEYKPIGQVKGVASQRHQLTSLLNDAYSNRDELEARIAQNKQNNRAARTKYGF